jgi:DNA-binding MarR family transcriptional regulator
MTQARMDLLHALKRARARKQPVWQSKLRRILGYTARSTMTQMVKALEALGWILRRRSPRDRRQVEVELTDQGQAKLARTYGRFFTGWSLVAPFLGKGWRPTSRKEDKAWDGYVDRIVPLRKALFNIRVALRDTATLRYPRWEEFNE